MRGPARALDRTADGHRMNKTEAEWELMLRSGSSLAGEQARVWGFEAISLRIGHGARYTPDFFVVTQSGRIEFHEVKGHWREAARVRIKVAAHEYPMFRFIAVRKKPKRDGGGWGVEEIKP